MLELETTSHYDLFTIKDKTILINEFREDIQNQKNIIKDTGDNLFSLLAFQSVFTLPLLINILLPFTQFRSFITLISMVSTIMLLLYNFRIKKVQKDQDSWFFKIFPKRDSILKLKILQEKYFILLSELAIQLEETNIQNILLNYLQDNKNFVSVNKIESYNLGIYTLRDHFNTKHYNEAAELATDLLADINPKYMNPYLHQMNSQAEQKPSENNLSKYFKKYL
jgi:hypothetical protein